MEDKIHINVQTPGGTVLEKDVSYVSLPTERGNIGVLLNHADMLCVLCPGILSCRQESGETLNISTGQGVARVSKNTVTVLLDKACPIEN